MEDTFQVEYIWGPLDGTIGNMSKLLDQVWHESPHEEHVKKGIYPVYELTDRNSSPVKYKFVGWSYGIGNEPRTG